MVLEISEGIEQTMHDCPNIIVPKLIVQDFIDLHIEYSKTCLKQPLKNRQNKGLKTNVSLMKVKSIAKCSLGAFCNTFDLH